MDGWLAGWMDGWMKVISKWTIQRNVHTIHNSISKQLLNSLVQKKVILGDPRVLLNDSMRLIYRAVS